MASAVTSASSAAAAVLLHALIAPVSAGGGPNAAPISDWKMGYVTFVVLTTIVIISVGFEKIKHLALHTANELTEPIVHGIFAEMTVLGFIGLVVFVVELSGVLETISLEVFGTGHDHTLAHLVHEVHLLLFAVMVLYLFMCFYLSYQAKLSGDRWAKGELMAGEEPTAVHQLITALKQDRETGGSAIFSVWRYLAGPHGAAKPKTSKTAKDRAVVAYLSLRTRFIELVTSPRAVNTELSSMKGFQDNFSLKDYFQISMTHLICETIEVPAWAWVGLEVVFLFISAGFVIEGVWQLIYVVAFGWAIILAMYIIYRKLDQIEMDVTPATWLKLAEQSADTVDGGEAPHARRIKPTKVMPADIEAMSDDEDMPPPPPPPVGGRVIFVKSGSDEAGFQLPKVGAPPMIAKYDLSSDLGLPDGADAVRKPVRRPSISDSILHGLKIPTHFGFGQRRRSPQESLFWFGHHGDHFLIYAIRFTLLTHAIYLSLLVLLMTLQMDSWGCFTSGSETASNSSAYGDTGSGYSSYTRHRRGGGDDNAASSYSAASSDPGASGNDGVCVVFSILGFVPTILFMGLLPPIFRKLVIVTSVEEMRSNEKLLKTVRYLKARKAMIGLKLLAKMKHSYGNTNHSRAKAHNRKGGGAAGDDGNFDADAPPHDKIPKPVDTSHIKLPESVEKLSEFLAEQGHNDWCASKRLHGWTHGEVRDDERKIHPSLVEWAALSDSDRSYNLRESTAQLKVIAALGFDIKLGTESPELLMTEVGEGGGHGGWGDAANKERRNTLAAAAHGASERKEELETIAMLSEMLAMNTHQSWAQGKIKDGFTWAVVNCADKKTSKLLVPFRELDNEIQDVNRQQSTAALQQIAHLGYRFIPKARQPSVRTTVHGHEHPDKPPTSYIDSSGNVTEFDSRKDIRKAFALFDTDRSGYIKNTSVMPALKTLGWALSETDAVQIILNMDTNDSGFIEFHEFAGWVLEREKASNANHDPQEMIRAVFSHIDSDNSGSITTSELLAALKNIGEDLEYDDITFIVNDADKNDDGLIDLNEFSVLLQRVSDD